jgi:hypothetical protein
MTDEALPLPNYDELTIGSLRERIGTLDVGDMRALIYHERRTRNRVPVLEVLTARLDQLAGAGPR